MKFTLKAVLVLIGVLGLSYWFLTSIKTRKLREDVQPTVAFSINDKSGLAPASFQGTRPAVAIPTGINFKPVALGTASAQLQSIIDVVSNAVLSVNRILKAKDYQVQEFSRTTWLTAEDNARLTKWRIFPYRTNAVIGTVEAIVYNDAAMTQKDLTRTFRMVFDQDTGSLNAFSWGDKHEVMHVLTNGNVDYGRNIGEKMGLSMRWDGKGNLISSNVYNWAKRGRVIHRTSSVDK